MIEEIRKQERVYNLKAKTLVEHGFSKLDYITREYLKYEEDTNNTKASKIILIAPTWGSDGIIESGFASTYIDEIISPSELHGWLQCLVEAAWQGQGGRRMKNPRIWSLHDLSLLGTPQS